MKVYRIDDQSGDCNSVSYYTNKRKALQAGKALAETMWPEEGSVEVELIDIGKIDQDKIIRILEGHGYAESITTIATFQGTRKGQDD